MSSFKPIELDKKRDLNNESKVDNNVSKQFGGKLDSGLDSQLLNREKDNDENSDDEKNSAELKKNKKGTDESGEEEKGSDNIRKNKKSSERKKNKTGKKTNKVKDKAKEGLKKASAQFLKFCWVNLIPSWGLTTLLLDLYVILRLTPLSLLLACELGEEWTADIKTGSSDAPDFLKKGNMGLKIGEPLLLLIVNLILFGVLFGVLVIIAFLVEIAQHPLEFYGAYVEGLWNLLQGIFT